MNTELLPGEGLKTLNCKNSDLCKKKAIRAVNNNTFKAHSNPLFSTLKVLKLSVLTLMHGYLNDNLPSSFQNMFKSLAETNRTKSYKLERVLNSNLESFPSAMFPKLWNAIEIELKETTSAKLLKQRVINIYLENNERFKCEKPSCISCE